MHSSDQIKAKTKALSAVAVTISNNFEALQLSNHIFVQHTLAWELVVLAFFFLAQLFLLAGLCWCPAVRMQLLQSLITAVAQDFSVCGHMHFAALVQRKIVTFAIRKAGAHHFGALLVHDNLALQRMPLFLPRVIMPLLIIAMPNSFAMLYFFFGRSIGVSDASTKITSYSASDFNSALRPGKLNSRLLMRTSSTHRQFR